MKKICALLTSLLLILTLTLPAAAWSNPFTDVPADDYYYKYVQYVNENGIFNGTSATTFEPDTPMTRAMFVTILGRTAGIKADMSAHSRFSDVPDSQWYTPYVGWADENGIVKGYSDTVFGPDDVVTEEQALVIARRFCDVMDIALDWNTASLTYMGNLSDWASDDVMTMTGAGYVHGHRGDGVLYPDSPATRAFAAELITLVSGKLNAQNEKYEALAKNDAAAAMLALKSDYPEGTPWTNADYYEWKGGIFSGGYGCAGFAFMLSDAAFGDLPARQVYDLSDAENTVRVGDILRINGDTHSVIVIGTDANGVTIAEGNYNYSVHWGRTLSWDDVKNADYMLTRYKK